MASGADHISALPEDVLHQVLRFLPAQEVVRTCVLARRWRRVWRSVPALRFTGAKGWGSADRFLQFVDHLMHLWCAGGDFGAPLDSCEFDFDLDGFMRLPAGQQHASRWIREAVSQVRALRVRVVEEQEASPLSDNLHLVSQHLTRLELIGVAVTQRQRCRFFRLPGTGPPEHGGWRCFRPADLVSVAETSAHRELLYF